MVCDGHGHAPFGDGVAHNYKKDGEKKKVSEVRRMPTGSRMLGPMFRPFFLYFCLYWILGRNRTCFVILIFHAYSSSRKIVDCF